MEEMGGFEEITDDIKKIKRKNINVSLKTGLKLHMLSLYHHKTMGTLVDELVANLWDKEKDIMTTGKSRKKIKKPVNNFLNGIRESFGLKRVE
jgi:hypothetical protein